VRSPRVRSSTARSASVVRAVLERTRGDLTTTMVASRLQAAIDAERADRNL